MLAESCPALCLAALLFFKNGAKIIASCAPFQGKAHPPLLCKQATGSTQHDPDQWSAVKYTLMEVFS